MDTLCFLFPSPPHSGSSGNGIELGWHSSTSIIRSGVRCARHCRRTRACRWRRRSAKGRLLFAPIELRGMDVILKSDMDKSQRVESYSMSLSNEAGPSTKPSSEKYECEGVV